MRIFKLIKHELHLLENTELQISLTFLTIKFNVVYLIARIPGLTVSHGKTHYLFFAKKP